MIKEEAIEEKDWHDVPSDEMTLEQARQAVKDLRKKLAEYLWQKPCNNTISRQVVLDKIEEVCFSKEQKWIDFRVSWGSNGQRDLIIKFIEDLPSVQPQPKTGHWINKSNQSGCGVNFVHIECSECGEPSGLKNTYAKYCPWCGAKMIGPQESEG